jgi:hypothetical protein
VDEADVKNRIAQKAGEFGTTKEALKKELEERVGMSRLEDMLLAESTLTYLLGRQGNENTKKEGVDGNEAKDC